MKSGLFIGLNKGYQVTEPKVNTRKLKPSYRKGKLGARVKFVKDLIREVAGFSPYEKRMLELLRAGTASKGKKAIKLAKKRLGTHKRAKAKREDLLRVIAESKKQ